MTFTDWVRESRKRILAEGLTGARESLYEFYEGIWRNAGKRYNYGRNVFDDSWDVLIVLDACRWDLMAEVEGQYDFVDDTVEYSVASSSGEWLSKTFDNADTDELAYVTANPFSKTRLDPTDFLRLDEVWQYAIDEDVRTIPADAVTDRTISAHRELDADRIVAHYMQPHYPFVPNPMVKGLPLHEFGQKPWDDVWDKLRYGEVTREEVWNNYRANLEYVLESVETVLDNVEGEVLITADHGNLMGEYGLYGHPDFVPLPSLKRVPWCKTEATDKSTHEPNDWRTNTVDEEREDLLKSLGYM